MINHYLEKLKKEAQREISLGFFFIRPNSGAAKKQKSTPLYAHYHLF